MKNTITYERLMEAIYRELMNEDLTRNVIETEELQKKSDDYEKRFLKQLWELSHDLYNEAWEDFADVTCGYCRSGFEAGFKAAVALFEAKGGSGLG